MCGILLFNRLGGSRSWPVRGVAGWGGHPTYAVLRYTMYQYTLWSQFMAQFNTHIHLEFFKRDPDLEVDDATRNDSFSVFARIILKLLAMYFTL